MWTYSQRTGALTHDGSFVARGYAGRNEGNQKGLNNPELQHVKGIGPIPQGDYTIEAPRDSATVGPYAMRLLPDPSNEMHGRDSFNMHGDKKGHEGERIASHGCVIMPRNVREQVWDSGDRRFRVTK